MHCRCTQTNGQIIDNRRAPCNVVFNLHCCWHLFVCIDQCFWIISTVICTSITLIIAICVAICFWFRLWFWSWFVFGIGIGIRVIIVLVGLFFVEICMIWSGSVVVFVVVLVVCWLAFIVRVCIMISISRLFFVRSRHKCNNVTKFQELIWGIHVPICDNNIMNSKTSQNIYCVVTLI